MKIQNTTNMPLTIYAADGDSAHVGPNFCGNINDKFEWQIGEYPVKVLKGSTTKVFSPTAETPADSNN